jgi:GNAT superfamily N-acetyltransferase
VRPEYQGMGIGKALVQHVTNMVEFLSRSLTRVGRSGWISVFSAHFSTRTERCNLRAAWISSGRKRGVGGGRSEIRGKAVVESL